ncbi:MAG TPA: D-alanine--D-alanine ligase [Clostridiales bacterium]|nr:D-alanine--D-alanine ligase [Clostridiales bacterium]
MEERANQDNIPPLQIGLTYNIKKNIKSEIIDIEAELDSMDTVQAIKAALQSDNCQVELMEADDSLPARLAAGPPHIVFNIAEGIQGRGREAQVPAILNYLRIPFTGSDETTLSVALDKALTKRLLASYHIRTPQYQIISQAHPRMTGHIRYPAIVKPNTEGSSKGISDMAIVTNRQELYKLSGQNIAWYRQDMLVEEYIAGREFTVGILGNGNEIRVFPPMEIVYLNRKSNYNIYSYTVKQNYKQLIRYDCPANISGETEKEMVRTARRIYEILACRDFSRIDFRLTEQGVLYFIEINPLPGLAPGYSDYPMLAEFSGMDYRMLVRNICRCALKRYNLDFDFQ